MMNYKSICLEYSNLFFNVGYHLAFLFRTELSMVALVNAYGTPDQVPHCDPTISIDRHSTTSVSNILLFCLYTYELPCAVGLY